MNDDSTTPVPRYRKQFHLKRIAQLGFWPDCRHRYKDGDDHCTTCDQMIDWIARHSVGQER